MKSAPWNFVNLIHSDFAEIFQKSKENNPKIAIQYELSYPFEAGNPHIELSLKKEPKVFVEYDTTIDDIKLLQDMEIIMRFFAILQGRSYYVDDIRVKLLDKDFYVELFYNFDFSYNYYTPYSTSSRVNIKKIINKINTYFTNWYEFSNNQSYNLLLDAFFLCNGKRKPTLIERFLTYCRFLEGYDLRTTGDEKLADSLDKELKKKLDENDIKEILNPIFVKHGSTYKSSTVAKWISGGFLNRKSLVDRLKKIDKDNFSIIDKNYQLTQSADSSECFLRIVITRNFYSHFKDDDSQILSYDEIDKVNKLLEGCILTLFLRTFGFEERLVKSMLVTDDRYKWYTQHLLIDIGNEKANKLIKDYSDVKEILSKYINIETSLIDDNTTILNLISSQKKCNADSLLRELTGNINRTYYDL